MQGRDELVTGKIRDVGEGRTLHEDRPAVRVIPTMAGAIRAHEQAGYAEARSVWGHRFGVQIRPWSKVLGVKQPARSLRRPPQI